PAVVLVHLEDLADVRMAHARGRACLAPEAFDGARVRQAGDHLDRHLAIQPLVTAGVDDAHAALSELARERVPADGAWQLQSCFHGRTNLHAPPGHASPTVT